MNVGGGYFTGRHLIGGLAIHHENGGVRMASLAEKAMVQTITDQSALIRELVGALNGAKLTLGRAHDELSNKFLSSYALNCDRRVEEIDAALSRVPAEYLERDK
jgi:hypothetical protein